MKTFNYVFGASTAILLSISSASVQAELCPVSTFDSTTASVTIPCAITGGLQLSLELEFVPSKVQEGFFWKLASSGASGCDWAPGSCATFGDELGLVVPLTLAD